MQRRNFNQVGLGALSLPALLTLSPYARAAARSEVIGSEASIAVKGVLEKSVRAAVGSLGVKDGFSSNPKARISVPPYFADAAKLVKYFGQQRKVDDFVAAINRAAEIGVPLLKDFLLASVKNTTVEDAKTIVQGNDTAATAYFMEQIRKPLATKVLQVMTLATKTAGLDEKHRRFAKRASIFGLLRSDNPSIEQYVTNEVIRVLTQTIGQQEQKIRQDPAATGNESIKQAFASEKSPV